MLLSTRDLSVHYFTYNGVAKVVNGINLSVHEGEMFGLVGESGSGKSVLAMSIINLIKFPGRIVAGQVLFRGENLLQKSNKQMTKIRGGDILWSRLIPSPDWIL